MPLTIVPIAVPENRVPAVGINGFGRIGRALFRLSLTRTDISLVAINHTALSLEHLLAAIRHDSTHGACPQSLQISIAPPDHPRMLPPTPNNPNPSGLLYKGRLIHLFSQRDAGLLDWRAAGAEYIMESTGKMLTRETAGVHLTKGGAKKVIISAPSRDVKNVVFGVNEGSYGVEDDVISNASCTTNCLAPIALVLQRAFGIETGMMTTVHASTASQKILDGFSTKDIRSGRSAMGNIIPATTGAAQAVVKVLPELKGKFHGISIRVPVTNVSLVDLTVTLQTPVNSKADLIEPFRIAATRQPFPAGSRPSSPPPTSASAAPSPRGSHGSAGSAGPAAQPRLGGVLDVSDEKLVSSDFLSSAYSCVIDVDATVMLNSTTAKIVAWYDNEYGFSSRMYDLAVYMAAHESA